MSLENRLAQAFEHVSDAINDGKIPGAVLGIIDLSGRKAIRCEGQAQCYPAAREMYTGTWFDLASLTKVLFTTPRILTLYDKGDIDLDEPICSVLKDFRQYDLDCWERKVTFKECLTHQTNFPAVEPLYTYGQSPDLLRAFILQRQWQKSDPVYSDINFILLGFVLERLEQRTIWDMDAGDGFSFSADPLNCAATEACTWRHRVLCGEVHDDNCSALQGAGHAGLFGTINSVLNAAHGILSESGYSTRLVDLMRTPVSANRTYGWECVHANWSGGQRCSQSTIGHTGFTGTGLWIDFDAGIAWSLLTNRIHPTRHCESGIAELRRMVGDELF